MLNIQSAIMRAATIIILELTVMGGSVVKAQTTDLKWSELAPIPDRHGFAGSFAGVSGGSLLVAGGANFPDGGAPWIGSKKAWTDQVFVLDRPDGQWKVAGKLPDHLGYGVSVTWKDQLICVGGSNEQGHHREVLMLTYQHGELKISNLPDLPYPLANTSGAVAGHTLYVAGGLKGPDDKRCASAFLSLDLSLPVEKQQWKELESWPGPARMLATAGAIGNTFYLFSGAELIDADNGGTKRRYLDDAYGFTPGKGWKKLAKMPFPTVAAPGPAYNSASHTLAIFGGDDGKLADRADLKEHHPGFNQKILSYDAEADQWKVIAEIPVNKKEDSVNAPNQSLWAPVTVPSVVWNGNIVFPGGEVRPAVRTPRVRMAIPVKH